MKWAHWVAAACVAASSALVHAAAPAIDFFKRPVLNDVELSPSGKYLAATRYNSQTKHHVLVIIDLSEKREAKIVAGYTDADVVDLQWVNDDRVVFRVFEQDATYFDSHPVGLFSVDRRGDEDPKVLIRRHWDTGIVNAPPEIARVRPRDFSLDPNHAFHSVLHDGSANVLVVKRNWASDRSLTSTQLIRLNTETGRSEVVGQGAPPQSTGWVADAAGNARVVYSNDKATTNVHWRATPQSDWAPLRRMPRYDKVAGKDAMLGMLGMDDQDRLYVVTGGANEDGTNVLATMDLKQASPALVPLIATPGYDFSGRLVYGTKGKVVGIHYLTDAKGTHWFDPKLKAIQEQVDKLLPNTNNIIDCGACDDPTRVLVNAYSDRQPSAFVLYHVTSGKVEPVSGTRPWIKTEEMAARGFERIKARDGLEFPVHVTRPNGSKAPAPAVILVHGGPWVRGAEWRWYPTTQFLASRGYAVIEPEFRGSTGFGSRLTFASWKQWGLAMQDDLADAARWAIDKGIADPKRICIAGGSYGGYAALMGLVRQSDIFRCGIEYFGVTDIELMYTSHWSDFSKDYKTYGMPVLIGDRVQDAAQLDATSPLKQSAKINAPLLMGHGRQDPRVPFEHYSKLLDKLKGQNPNVETVVYNEEGHGWNLDANEADFWTRAETFLDKHLKAAP
ncbi:MAG: S9 family peptidase [Vitreoscilla sp.]|nr:S9 family peptidase [Vitreoscilla sp.]